MNYTHNIWRKLKQQHNANATSRRAYTPCYLRKFTMYIYVYIQGTGYKSLKYSFILNKPHIYSSYHLHIFVCLHIFFPILSANFYNFMHNLFRILKYENTFLNYS